MQEVLHTGRVKFVSHMRLTAVHVFVRYAAPYRLAHHAYVDLLRMRRCAVILYRAGNVTGSPFTHIYEALLSIKYLCAVQLPYSMIALHLFLISLAHHNSIGSNRITGAESCFITQLLSNFKR